MTPEEIPRSASEPVRRPLDELRLAQLAEAVEQSPVSIVITDTTGAIEYVNRKFTEITGYAREEAKGQNPRILKSGAQGPEVYRELWQTITSGGEWRGELQNRKKSGELYWESVSIFPLRDPAGRITHFLAVKEDVNRQKQHEAALRQFNGALEDAIARAQAMTFKAEMASIAKSQFLAHMSHEIRTPMNGVIGMTDLLLDTGLNDLQRSYANTIRSSAEALLDIINDILDFSKIEARKLELEAIPFDLPGMLEEAVELLAPRAHTKGLELICAVAPGVPSRVCGDPGRLRQIIFNLMGNALKFTSAGEVVLRVRREAESAGRVVLRFEVTDTGIGIPANQIGRLFAAFTQVDGSHARKFGGTGLGLAIAKQLAELMGGKIGVSSEPGRGSTFWFTVSLENPSPPVTAAECPPGQAGPLAPARILVLDDNATVRDLLVEWLAALGACARGATDGAEAFDAVRSAAAAGAPFDAVIVDQQMPQMSGVAFLRRLWEERAETRPRALLLRSPGAPSPAEDLPGVALAGEIVKPVRQSQLLPGLCRALGRSDEAPAPAKMAAAPRSPSLAGRRILLAEDNPTNRLVAVAFLRKLGCEVDVAVDGRAAVERVQARACDLVLMDCQMPEMDGIEATECIRKAENGNQSGRVPIVAMTAETLGGTREACLRAGMDDFLTKPVSLPALAATLEKWLPQRSAEVVAAAEAVAA